MCKFIKNIMCANENMKIAALSEYVNTLKKEAEDMKNQRDECLSKNTPSFFETYLDSYFPQKIIKYTKRWIFNKNNTYEMDIRDFCKQWESLPKLDSLEAVFKYTIQYVSDSFEANGLLDYWQLPAETYKLGKGDCLPSDTLLLRNDYKTVPISEIQIGDYIAGMNGEWTKVTNKWNKGMLPLLQIKLSNGCYLRCTKDHRMFLSNGKEINASEIMESDTLLTAKIIPAGQLSGDPDFYKLLGLHVADGWCEDYRFSISGKDGHPKEEQKKWVKSFCEKHGINYRWDERYIAVNSKELTKEMDKCGHGAKNKHLERIDFTTETIKSILEGLNADSAYRNCRVFRTTSEELAMQYRILNRMLGFSTHMKLIEKHGGLGKNPIWELNVRKKGSCHDKITVREIKNGEDELCYDIETENNGIYLPEADVVVHNCDDSGVLRMSLARKLGNKDVFCAIGMYGNVGHLFNLMYKNNNFYIVENTSNAYDPVKIPDNNFSNAVGNYRINYIFNENKIWEVDGSVIFGKYPGLTKGAVKKIIRKKK